jgi:dihydropteroate synthase
MAILNVTPDSFSDGGRFATAEAAVAEGARAADLGAALVDVGGESTRPRGAAYGAGAAEVDSAEELRRVLPVVEVLRRTHPGLPISVDTRKAEVAEACLAAGADVVNLVTGLDAGPELLDVVARHGAALILNHCRGTPQSTFAASRFEDVVAEVALDLEAARATAVAAGVAPERILLDPGLGFGKSSDDCFALLAGLDRLAPAGVPLVVGASRKAFLGTVRGTPATDRLPESLGAVAVVARLAALRPALVRVHDTAETLAFLAVLARGHLSP